MVYLLVGLIIYLSENADINKNFIWPVQVWTLIWDFYLPYLFFCVCGGVFLFGWFWVCCFFHVCFVVVLCVCVLFWGLVGGFWHIIWLGFGFCFGLFFFFERVVWCYLFGLICFVFSKKNIFFPEVYVFVDILYSLWWFQSTFTSESVRRWMKQ